MHRFGKHHASFGAVWACCALIWGSNAIAQIAPDDAARLLKHADDIKSEDNVEFARIIKRLDAESAHLAPEQAMYLRYLKGWQTAYFGDYRSAIAQLNAVANDSNDVTLRFRAGMTAINVQEVAKRYADAYARLNELLALLPRVSDPTAREQGMLVSSELFNSAGQHDLALHFANMELAESTPGSKAYCKGMSRKLDALNGAGMLHDANEFAIGIEACVSAHEPIFAGLIRSYAATFDMAHDRQSDAIQLLQANYDDAQRTQYPELIAIFDSILAQAYWKTGDVSQAQRYALRVIDSAIKNEDIEPLVNAYDVLYRVARKQNNYQAALAYHEKYAAADKGYLSDVSARALAYQQVHQQVAARKAEIATLNQQNQLLTLKREVDAKNLLAVRLGVALMLVLLGSLGLYALRTRRSQLKFQKLAQRDGLTEIHNRQYFIECAQAELRYCRKSLREASLISFDLDHFKQINDTHGHAAGDVALKAAVAACQKHLRSVDIFGRLGGEEFGILLPDTIPARAADIAEAMRAQIAALQGSDGGPEFAVTASFGIASARAAGYDLTQLLAQADDALYQAKRSGRDRVITHGTFAPIHDGLPPGVPERRHA